MQLPGQKLGCYLVLCSCFHFCVFFAWPFLREPVLLEINDTQIYLQTKGINLQRCDIKLEALKEFPVKNRQKVVNIFSLLLNDDHYECQLTQLDHDDIDKDEFLVERKRLQHFIAVATSHSETNAWKEDPLKLLQFINKYNLANSVPNILVMLRIFLTIAISVATCERSFSKLKLVKNYLRSTMSSLRMRNLAILSIETTYR